MSHPFRFESVTHSYVLDGQRVPSITQMLKQCGLVDDRWWTDASRERGTHVHTLTAMYDLGALTDVPGCTSRYKGWLQAHVLALGILQPELLQVEVPRVHPIYQFGGRPDREIKYQGRVGVLEVKSGAEEPGHAVQTALQCLLVAPIYHLPPQSLVRLCLYLKADGWFRVLEHVAVGDFIEARKVIKECCR